MPTNKILFGFGDKSNEFLIFLSHCLKPMHQFNADLFGFFLLLDARLPLFDIFNLQKEHYLNVLLRYSVVEFRKKMSCESTCKIVQKVQQNQLQLVTSEVNSKEIPL